MCSQVVGPALADAPSFQPAVIAAAHRRYPSWQDGRTVRYTITTEEERTTDDPLPEGHVLSLRRVMDVTFTPQEMKADGSGSMRGTLHRVELNGRSGHQFIRYDSRQDKPGQGNTTADLLAAIVGREFRIRLGPGGQFEEFTGFNTAWRSQGLLAAPASVVSIQFLFRDHAMLGLLRESLSPTLGREAEMPGEIPGVAMLECAARFNVEPRNASMPHSRIRVQGQGDVRATRPDADIPTAGLLCEVTSGRQTWDLLLDTQTHQIIHNEMIRDVVLTVKLVPPTPSDSPATTIRQNLRIIASRE
jgi:hypothetical protein